MPALNWVEVPPTTPLDGVPNMESSVSPWMSWNESPDCAPKVERLADNVSKVAVVGVLDVIRSIKPSKEPDLKRK